MLNHTEENMRYALTAPPLLSGQVVLPSSKSISNRVLVISALARGKGKPGNLSVCDDTIAMRRALVSGEKIVNVGAAGTAMRFLTAYFSLVEGERLLTGTQRMLHRPISVLVDALVALGAEISYEGEDGFPPLRIKGATLHGGSLNLSGKVSSQYVSALLMIAPLLPEPLIMTLVGGVVSKPYIDMTLSLMRCFGAHCRWADDCTLVVEPGGYEQRDFCVESDWSAASYWYELVALSPDKNASVSLPSLFRESLQGDARVSEFFASLGVETLFREDGVEIRRGGGTDVPMNLNLEGQPDLAQTLVATCVGLGRPFRFCGLGNLKIKETDRIAALCAEMHKFGVSLQESSEGALSWDGKRNEVKETPIVNTYEDHRMALSFAPLSFVYPFFLLDAPDVVSKSYPSFWRDLEQMGFQITQYP